MPALNPAPLSTGVVPDSGVGPAADSVHAVATAVPPLSFTTTLRRCSCAQSGAMVMVWAWVAVRPVESTTFIVKLKVPAAVGVPVIAPVEGASVRPGGRVPAETDQVNGVASMMGYGVVCW